MLTFELRRFTSDKGTLSSHKLFSKDSVTWVTSVTALIKPPARLGVRLEDLWARTQSPWRRWTG